MVSNHLFSLTLIVARSSFALDQSTLIYFVRPQINRVFRSLVTCMTDGGNQEPVWKVSEATIDLAIRFGIIALLGYWSAHVISPFLTIGGCSAILAVALYPLFDRLAGRVGPRVAASLITLLCLTIVIGPVMWLGFGMISGIETLVAELNAGQLAIPFPPDSVRTWPVIGARVHELWILAATNMKAALAEVTPMLKPVGAKLLGMSESAFFGLLELLVSIVIAGFLFSRGPQMIDALSVILGRALGLHGKKLVQLPGCPKFEREHSAECAPIVRRILGARPGAKRISSVDPATLAAIHHSRGDLDGTCRHAIMIELQRAGGVMLRSIGM